MRTLVFGILFANLLTLQSFKTKAETHQPEGDTVIIRLKNKNQIMVITQESKNLESFRTINLNKLIADIDSAFKAEESNGNQAMLNMEIRKKDSVLRIQVINPQLDSDKKSYKAIVKVLEMEDGRSSDTTYRDVKKVSFDFQDQGAASAPVLMMHLRLILAGTIMWEPMDNCHPTKISPMDLDPFGPTL